MKKYLAFGLATFKEELSHLSNSIGTVISFSIHIIVLSQLWKFVLAGKLMQGYNYNELVWYSILSEIILYSFYAYYRKIAANVEAGDIAYNLSKPYNFMGRIISEGFATLPMTFVMMFVGSIVGLVIAGPLALNALELLCISLIVFMSATCLLIINMIVGLLAIWMGREISSVWLLLQKTMLIFVFTPVELMPKFLQLPLKLLPTTNVIYTPSKLLVKFSYTLFVESLLLEILSFVILGTICYIIYRKGAKNLNVNGV